MDQEVRAPLWIFHCRFRGIVKSIEAILNDHFLIVNLSVNLESKEMNSSVHV